MPEEKTAHNKAESKHEAIKTKSKGERLFDRAVYGGIAGVGTFLVTLPIALGLKHGKWAGGSYGQVVDWVEKKATRFFAPKLSRTIAEEGTMTTALMMGGNAMVLPVGVAEHYKTAIVSGLNTALGDPTPPEAIEQAPKQTWSSLLEGRLLAWGAVFTTLFSASMALPKSFAMFKAEFAERTHQVVQWFRREPVSSNMTKTTSYRVGELAALDVFATAAAASLLYVGGHFFARKHEEKKAHPQQRRQRTAVEMPPVGMPAASADDAEVTPQSQIQGAKTAEGVVHVAAPAHTQRVNT